MKVSYLNINRANKNLLPEYKKAIEKVIKSGVLVLGNEVSEFEYEYAKFSGVKYSAGLANGLDALILSLNALGVSEGDEVILPSNTYIATVIAVTRMRAKPIFVEPKIETYNINPQKIEEKITKKTKAIIPVHLFGQACEMSAIMKIAKKHKLFVIEDNAQSHGATYNDKITGSFGVVNATSFYPGKNLGALGDGGAITTDSFSLYEKIKVLRNYGSREKYFNDVIGYNSRLDELQAAFLKIKLKKLEKDNILRQKNASKYIKGLSGVGDLILPETEKNSTHVYHVFVLRTKKRDSLRKNLELKGIGSLIHYPIPPHLQQAYKNLGFKKGDFPIAEELASTSLSIPIFPEITNQEIEYVIKSIRGFYAK